MRHFIISLFALVALGTPALADDVHLSGEWIGVGYGCTPTPGPERIRIDQSGDEVVATKLAGDDCVLTGQVTWRGKLKGGAFSDVHMQVSTGPATGLFFVDATLTMVNDTLVITPSGGSSVTYSRAEHRERYQIKNLDFEDHDLTQRMNILKDRLDKADDVLERAKQDQKKAERQLDAATGALQPLEQRLRSAEATRDEAEHTYMLVVTGMLDRRDQTGREKEHLQEMQDRVRAARAPYDKALATVKQAGDAYRDALDAVAAAEAARAGILGEQVALAKGAALGEIRVVADGKVVFLATAAQDKVAEVLGPIEDNLRQTRAALAKAKAAQAESEAALLRAMAERQRADEELQIKMMDRAWTEFVLHAASAGIEVLKGGIEGGWPGALWAGIKFELKQQATAHFFKDPDLGAEVAKELDEQGWPTEASEGTILGKAAKKELRVLAVNRPAGDAIAVVAKPAIDAVKDYVNDAWSGHARARMSYVSSSIGVREGMVKELGEVVTTVENMGNKQVWLALAKAKGLSVLAGAGIDMASDAVQASLKERARIEEAQAWASVMVATRIEVAQRKLFQKISDVYWSLKQTERDLLDAESKLIADAKLGEMVKNGGFVVQTNEPFDEGAQITVSATPSLASFDLVTVAIGGRRAVPDASGQLQVTAKELSFTGRKPRLVVLTVSVGGKRF
jgi:hypothetical protein